MDATTVAIDLEKKVFEFTFRRCSGRIVECKRLSQPAFSQCLLHHPPLRVVMEAYELSMCQRLFDCIDDVRRALLVKARLSR